jgi:hypothetical protein
VKVKKAALALGLICVMASAACATQSRAGQQAQLAPPSANVAPRQVVAGHPEAGPPHPEIGITYPFDLFVHCGGQFATFGGSTWETANPPGDLGAQPAGGGIATYTGYLAGWMTEVDPQTAYFTSSRLSKPVPFHPTHTSPPECA